MTKWAIKKNQFGRLEVWKYIDTLEEAKKYWYVNQAIRKYGVDEVLPIAMNSYGGYHSLKWDIENDNIVDIIESEKEPKLELWQEYSVNSKNFYYGWLSPDCISYGCGYMDHVDLARKICETLFERVDNAADDYLFSHGWAKINNEGWFGLLWKMNDKQVEWLEDRGIKNYLGGE